MAYSCVRVYFEIGHEASLRNKRTIEGFTHDWEVFVRGVDNAEIHHFVDKVVFHLHDTFPKPKRTIKEPPYCLKESGYAGFNLPIDIYFKNKAAEHRKQRIYYDLTLPEGSPRLAKLIKEKADFPNPPEDFRRKLIRGGGVGVGSDTTSSIEKANSITTNSHGDDSKSSPHSGKPKLNNSNPDVPKKHKPKETLKPEESRGSSFAALFGTPIKTIKHSPTSKPAAKPSSSSELKSSHEKQAKESSKISKHSPHKDKDKDKENSLSKYKDKDRDKEKDNEKSNKDKDKNKDKEHKEKDKSKDKILKKSNSPIPPKDIRKDESTKKSSEENKDKSNSKNDAIKEKKHKEKKHKEEREKKDVHKDHEKKEIEKEKVNDKIEKKPENPREKDVKENKLKSNEKEEKKIKPIEREKDRAHISEKQKHKHKRKEKHRKEDDKDRHKKKPKEKTPEPIPPPKAKSPTPPPPPPPPPVPTKPVINPLNMLIQELSDKDSDSDFSVSMEEDVKSDPPSEPPPKPKIEEKKIDVREEREKFKKKEKKIKDEDKDKESKKRKRKTKDKDEPVEKIVKTEIKEEPPEKSPKREERSESPETQFTEDYVTQLRDLQQKIMTLQDNADLQRVVQVISETGQFEITQRTFDFDLCALDRSTVKRLQDMFITAS